MEFWRPQINLILSKTLSPFQFLSKTAADDVALKHSFIEYLTASSICRWEQRERISPHYLQKPWHLILWFAKLFSDLSFHFHFHFHFTFTYFLCFASLFQAFCSLSLSFSLPHLRDALFGKSHSSLSLSWPCQLNVTFTLFSLSIILKLF